MEMLICPVLITAQVFSVLSIWKDEKQAQTSTVSMDTDAPTMQIENCKYLLSQGQ